MAYTKLASRFCFRLGKVPGAAVVMASFFALWSSSVMTLLRVSKDKGVYGSSWPEAMPPALPPPPAKPAPLGENVRITGVTQAMYGEPPLPW